MKKVSKALVALLLVIVMLMVTACTEVSDIKKPSSVEGDSSATTENKSTEKETTGTEPTEDKENNATDNKPDTKITIEETVLYNADGIVVTATGFAADGFMGPEVKLQVENNSAKNVLITAESVSVNGYMMPTASLYAEVAAGKKSNEGLLILTSELEQSGIETIAQIQFYIDVSDAATWTEIATSDLLTLNTSAAGFEQPVDDSGDVLYDSNGIKIVCKGLKQDDIWDGVVVFYMENNSNEQVTVSAENVSVNGFMEEATLWSDLRNGTRIVDGMSFLDLSDLGLESIEGIKSIELTFKMINSETWDEIDTTDVITLNFA